MQNQSLRIVFTLTLCALLMSCGTSTRRMPIPEVGSSRPTLSTSTMGSLPPTAKINPRGYGVLAPLDVAFKTQTPDRLETLYGRLQIRNLSIVSNCDSDILKAFVVQRWVPIVLLQYGNRRHLWAVIGYDTAERIYLQNPANRGERRPTIADFEQEWKSASAGKCLLITQQQLNEARVQTVLKKYLPVAKASQVMVRSRYSK